AGGLRRAAAGSEHDVPAAEGVLHGRASRDGLSTESTPSRTARDLFESDWRRTTMIELDEITCRLAADIGEQTGLRALDSLHVGAATRVGVDVLSFLTYDVRQAQVARQL